MALPSVIAFSICVTRGLACYAVRQRMQRTRYPNRLAGSRSEASHKPGKRSASRISGSSLPLCKPRFQELTNWNHAALTRAEETKRALSLEAKITFGCEIELGSLFSFNTRLADVHLERDEGSVDGTFERFLA